MLFRSRRNINLLARNAPRRDVCAGRIDPRDAIEAYFRSYFSQEDISVSDIDSELVVVLAGRGDKQKLMELAESHNDDEFFRQLNLNDTQAYRHQGQALNQGKVYLIHKT